MKKIITIILLSILGVIMIGCDGENTKTPDVIEKETSIIEIQSDITKMISDVEAACIAIVATTSEGKSLGSGVIYKKEKDYYYAITNQHVVDGATSVMINLGGKKYYNAAVLGEDAKNDLAIIYFSTGVTKEELKVIPIDENDDIIKKGQYVIAVGCPLSLTYYNYTTLGVVTKVTNSNIYHDAAINPGNSGGPLFNVSGRLVGINYAKQSVTSSDSGTISVEGVGFAIPMDTVRKVVSQIEKTKTAITRPLLGITVETVNRFLSSEVSVAKLPNILDQGVFVVEVSNNSNAANAGIKVDDIIYKVNDVVIEQNEDISNVLNFVLKGDSITVIVYRKVNGEFSEVTLTVKMDS